MKTIVAMITAMLMTFSAGALAADTFTAGPMSISDPWSRETPPGVSKAVAYMTITNNGDSPVTLIGAATPKAGDVTLHQSKTNGDMVTMKLVQGGLSIPAGETVALEPRGYHFMMEDLDRGLVRNESVAMTVTFEGAGAEAVNIKVHVKPAGAMDH